MSSTEVLLRAGSTIPLATSAATNPPSAALSPEPTDDRGFATFRIGETTSSLRCTHLQRGWREPLSLVIRTAADVASAGFTSHLDGLRDGTAAVVALAGQLQRSAATAAAQTLSVAAAGVAEEPQAEGRVAADKAQAGAVAHSSVPNLVLPAPSPATAAAYPVVDPPDKGPAKEPVRAAHRPGFRQAVRPEGSGRVLLQARLHVASATADLTDGAGSRVPLLKATMAAVGLSGASPGLPSAPRGGSAAATPQGPVTIAEPGTATRQPARTPMSASVWLQQTDGGVHGGSVFTDIPWQLSVASITTEVAAAQGSGAADGADHSSRDSDPSSGLASTSLSALVIRQPSALRQLLRVGRLTADVAAMAQQQRAGDSLPAAQLQGDAH